MTFQILQYFTLKTQVFSLPRRPVPPQDTEQKNILKAPLNVFTIFLELFSYFSERKITNKYIVKI